MGSKLNVCFHSNIPNFVCISVDQVRSLNSFIHNNESMFQYFSIDFNRLSWSAVHMSYIVNQAIFVNDAIGTIQKLYKKIHGTNS
jgi:hypothetical protein